MFDTIGRTTQDDEATARSAAALGIVLVVLTSCWCTAVGYGLMTTTPAVTLPVEVFDDAEPMPMVELDLTPAPVAPAGEPPPAAAPKAAAAVDDGVSEPEPDPPEDEQIPQELTDPPEDDVTSQERPQGTESGVVGGITDGVPGGLQTGVLNGTGGAPCPGCTPNGVQLRRSDVRIRRKVEPKYPEEARTMGLNETVCRLRVSIGPSGVPTDVQVSECPKVFHASARRALFAWRFYPARVGGQKVPAQFSIRIRYRLRD